MLSLIAQSGVPIKQHYGFGRFESLGDATNLLVMPAFFIASTAVVIYFLVGAFKLIVSHGDKAEVASARGMITHAIIGFILLIFMFLIFEFLPQWFELQRLQFVR